MDCIFGDLYRSAFWRPGFQHGDDLSTQTPRRVPRKRKCGFGMDRGIGRACFCSRRLCTIAGRRTSRSDRCTSGSSLPAGRRNTSVAGPLTGFWLDRVRFDSARRHPDLCGHSDHDMDGRRHYLDAGIRSRVVSVEYVLSLGVGSLAVPLIAMLQHTGLGFDTQFAVLAISSATVFTAGLFLPKPRRSALQLQSPQLRWVTPTSPANLLHLER